MNSAWHKPPSWLIWLMWLSLPLSWLEYRQSWDQLPVRMAVHFDANWRPNGFTSREGSLMLGLGIMAAMLFVFTIVSFAMRALKPQAAWPALVFSYVVLGLCWYGNHSIIRFNLNAQPAHAAARVSRLSVFSSQGSQHEWRPKLVSLRTEN